ncbi:MAG: DNA adenine methylase [Actinomycetota bacterium]|nr:DNA adenine methylase [Actinomycetota bacterium]
MGTVNYQKAPFPWFLYVGGKSKAAPVVWQALGDVDHYVEPFFGSGAVLLNRPHLANRTYHSETVNDLDGLLVNTWRAIQLHPDETAEAASWPVSEADLHARHLAIVRWRAERDLERLMADPAWCDPMVAGWWLWGIACWIGSGWCSGRGAWTERDGRLVKQDRAGAREPGVKRNRPHLGNNGVGVNRPQLREPGVAHQRPHLGDNGLGVNRPQLREPGVKRQLPHLGNNGQGVNRPQLREPGVGDVEWHPMTMPELRNWFGWLAARLRHVRILNGDWKRAVTTGASKTITVRIGDGVCGVFLDPPYADTADRDADLYTVDSLSVAHDVRGWCLAHGDDPDYRIVLAGFEGEHGTALESAGWREVEWFTAGFLTGGMGNAKAGGGQQARERLWLSPHCLGAAEPEPDPQQALF